MFDFYMEEEMPLYKRMQAFDKAYGSCLTATL